MFKLTANFPENFVILPGKNKFPGGIPKWQKKRATPKRGWENAKQLMLLTGKKSGVTCVDVDDDVAWWDAFSLKHQIPETTTVRTPSGGFHYYFKYCKIVTQTTRLWRKNIGVINVDIRNDNGVACLPGSVYEIAPKDREKKKDKLKYLGKLYEFLVKEDGTVLDFAHLKPMPMVIREIKRWGVNKETMELRVPKPKYRKFKDITAGSSVLTEEQLSTLLQAVRTEGKYNDSNYTDWFMMVWTACAICDLSGIQNKFRIIDAFSQGDNYDCAESVQKHIDSYDPDKFPPKDNPLSYLLSYLPKHSQTREALLRDVKRQYYFVDHENLWGLLDRQEVYEYFGQALRVVERRGVYQTYLRKSDEYGNDKWECGDALTPFQTATDEGPFTYTVKMQKTHEDGTVEEYTEIRNSRLKDEYNRNWKRYVKRYSKTVTKQWIDDPPDLGPREMNLFQGYPHKLLSDEDFDTWTRDAELQRQVDKIRYHFDEVLAAGNKDFAEYQMSWWAYVLRYGYNKVGTVLLYASDEGSGKGIMVVDFMAHGIIGKRYCFVCTDLKRYTGNFSAHRAGKIFVVMNECLDVTKANGADFDKVKAMITDKEFVMERKNKACYMSEETAAYVMLSNWATCVRMGNGDRRYVPIRMSDKHKGDHKYFIALAAAVENKRVQRYWYNVLARRDISNWQKRDIPVTELKTEIKAASRSNMFLRYLTLVVTEELQCWWDPTNEEKDHWYKMATVRHNFSMWAQRESGKKPNLQYHLDDVIIRAGEVIRQQGGHTRHPWKTKGAYKKKVNDRCLRQQDIDFLDDESWTKSTQKEQCVCYHITKPVVKELHRVWLQSPDWDFDS